MKRKIFNINKVDKTEADIINKSFEELYQHKLEETAHRNSAGSLELRTYRGAETGEVLYANASSITFSHTIIFATKYNHIFHTDITPIGTAVRAFITDITQSQMTIKINATSTSTKVRVLYRVVGSQE